MPASYMSLFPHVLNSLELTKIPVQAGAALAGMQSRSLSLCFEMAKSAHGLSWRLMGRFLPLILPADRGACDRLVEIHRQALESFLSLFERNVLEHLDRFHQKRLGELEFLNLFTTDPSLQDWTFEYDTSNVLLDLPSLRLIDISADVKHRIHNYAVVFAPRAGHHSNIAERVALFMRDRGLSRMAIVEQKCAEDIPLYVKGKRHYEGFDSQVKQYKKILEHLKSITGYSPHLIAVCQPGPLLISTLILYPHLGKTFGSAGAPMNTDGERGYLTDFARMVGEDYIEKLIDLLGYTISDEHVGAGRRSYDGRLQVLGFYFLGMDQHARNFRSLLADLRQGNEEAAERQKVFYQWYNYVHHSPLGFIRDTYKRIFVRNELIRDTLRIGGKKISIEDYPGSVPIWAIGGLKDEITPPLQATGHMALINAVPPEDKLKLLCETGHMGLFRSTKVLEEYYHRIVEFIVARSDRVNRAKRLSAGSIGSAPSKSG